MCEQGENIYGYGWDEYDVWDGGVQLIYDDGNKIDIIILFVKIVGGEYGGSWVVCIKGQVQEGVLVDFKIMVYYYIV